VREQRGRQRPAASTPTTPPALPLRQRRAFLLAGRASLGVAVVGAVLDLPGLSVPGVVLATGLLLGMPLVAPLELDLATTVTLALLTGMAALLLMCFAMVASDLWHPHVAAVLLAAAGLQLSWAWARPHDVDP
jgi:hypothetical protein